MKDRTSIERAVEKKRILVAIYEASEKGVSEQEIATLVNMSQPNVHRTLRRITRFPEIMSRTPLDIIYDRALGRLSTQQMMDELAEFPYTFAIFPEGELQDGMILGSWDDIPLAYANDLITEDEYELLEGKVNPPF